ncbi:3-phytase [Lutibacter oricola]|uniref:3-phytase n=1 Tax=Lutibacter oricola TaxID=762486 RepID=A0A1H3ACL1_9FLAO|nr:phytase [Lutibacter oricola]SDX27305.1 3-phytase [Lutibacter oricola]
MKKIILILVFIVTVLSCKVGVVNQKEMQLKPVVNLVADFETDPVSKSDDAADDSCIWIHKKDVSKSTIIGTNKQEGLVVYNLQGKEIYNYPIGRVNNVDLRDNFMFKGKKVTVVSSSNRTYNTITLHIVNENTGELIDVTKRPIVSSVNEVYGLGMYKSPKTGKFYVIVNSKDGGVEQWEIFEDKGYIDAKVVRNIVVGGQTEGVVCDDYYGNLYIGEEENALWKYNAEPNKGNKRTKIISTEDLNMKADFEGITIYDSGKGEGYVILSSQGNNSYAVFDRISNQYKGSFLLKDGKSIDGTYDTDGIDVTNVNFGGNYTKGFFVAQDGANTKGKDSLNQNFKIINWKKIEEGLKLQ